MLPLPIQAIYNPTSVPNNLYGIHIVNEAGMEDAALLVNSSGGDWGYVKLVIEKDDRDVQKWQRVFDKMRDLHLIPVIRLATKPTGDYWEKPTIEDAESWADFLGSLNWVIQNRYVVIFNEPNHAKEWGEDISPVEYAKVLKAYSAAFKDKDENFFVLNAGFDASAPNEEGVTMDEKDYLIEMVEFDPKIFEVLDGISSHSYPNPDFSGSPFDLGKGTVSSFLWEKDYLKELGLKKDLPIFITETGWSSKDLDPETISDNFVSAFETIWTKDNVVAVIPFILNYQEDPFREFSWITDVESSEERFSSWFEAVFKLPKTDASPLQLVSATKLSELPQKLVQESVHRFNIEVENNGQAIWDSSRNYQIVVQSDGPVVEIGSPFFKIYPGQKLLLPIIVKTPEMSGNYKVEVLLENKGQVIGTLLSQEIGIVSPLKLNFTAKSAVESKTSGLGFELTVYDKKEEVLNFSNVSVTDGVGNIPEIHNLVPGKEYLFELKNKRYFPNKTKGILDEGNNTVRFGLIIPFDLDANGRFDVFDFMLTKLYPFNVLTWFGVSF